MPYIEITEKDETSPGIVDESFDVVFVPGFVNENDLTLWRGIGTSDSVTDVNDCEYIGLAPNTPTLFRSVKEFEAMCGRFPVKFVDNEVETTEDKVTLPEGFNSSPAKGQIIQDFDSKIVGEYDPGYIYAKEILASGMPVVYVNISHCSPKMAKVDGKLKVFNYAEKNLEMVSIGHRHLRKDFYSGILTAFDTSDPTGIVDKGNFNIKYLTTGGYPLYGVVGEGQLASIDGEQIMTKMIAMAATRGDCVALVDYNKELDANINPNSSDSSSLFQKVNSEGEITDGEFAAMFMPWATYSRITSDVESSDTTKKVSANVDMPASFAYLKSLAHSIKTNANWLAIAGAARGSVRNLDKLNVVVPNAVADAMQKRTGTSINAITNIKPYGNTIWGNRTLKLNEENLTATSFLNIRNLVSDVKKTVYRSARRVTFEQDSDVMWLNFKTDIATLLDRMKSGYGISGYKIIRNYEHARAAEKATVCAKIVLYPTYAVEDFYIDVILKDGEVTIE